MLRILRLVYCRSNRRNIGNFQRIMNCISFINSDTNFNLTCRKLFLSVTRYCGCVMWFCKVQVRFVFNLLQVFCYSSWVISFGDDMLVIIILINEVWYQNDYIIKYNWFKYSSCVICKGFLTHYCFAIISQCFCHSTFHKNAAMCVLFMTSLNFCLGLYKVSVLAFKKFGLLHIPFQLTTVCLIDLKYIDFWRCRGLCLFFCCGDATLDKRKNILIFFKSVERFLVGDILYFLSVFFKSACIQFVNQMDNYY